MSVVPIVSDQDPSEDEERLVFTEFLKDLTGCKSLVEVNIAAGIALEVLVNLQA